MPSIHQYVISVHHLLLHIGLGPNPHVWAHWCEIIAVCSITSEYERRIGRLAVVACGPVVMAATARHPD